MKTSKIYRLQAYIKLSHQINIQRKEKTIAVGTLDKSQHSTLRHSLSVSLMGYQRKKF